MIPRSRGEPRRAVLEATWTKCRWERVLPLGKSPSRSGVPCRTTATLIPSLEGSGTRTDSCRLEHTAWVPSCRSELLNPQQPGLDVALALDLDRAALLEDEQVLELFVDRTSHLDRIG